MKASLKLAFLFAVFYDTFALGQSGIVRGTVVDQHGKPVEGAVVNLLARGGPFAGHHLVKGFETKEDGSFEAGSVAYGTYWVCISKDIAGYPDQKLAFYSNLKVPVVTVGPDSSVVERKIKLGPKAAFLEVSTPRDAVTGKEIVGASITVKRQENNYSITTSAPFKHLAVPAKTNITCQIKADGYKPYICTEKSSSVLNLSSESIVTINPSLYRDK